MAITPVDAITAAAAAMKVWRRLEPIEEDFNSGSVLYELRRTESIRQPNAPAAEASNTAPTATSAMSGPDVELPPVWAPPSGNAIVVGVTNASMPDVVAVVPAAATVVVDPANTVVLVVPAAATVVVDPANTVPLVVSATVVVVAAATVVVVVAAAAVVVVAAAAVVVVAAAAVVVVVAAAVVVVVAAVVVVVVASTGAAQPTWVIVLVSMVTAPLRASALPEIDAPFCRLMEVRARMVPRKVVLANRSAELPTCQ
jgi:hypothetical protein